MDEKKNKKQQEKTPIIDGDTRPDQYPVDKDLNKARENKQKDFTANRKADVNSLEDFKDKK
ncbi:MAG TPA: hypothetical protein VD927_05225 [Chryseosolibacter sp.]|nr:hypothetical protein [Chryseosolibacter sp.]